ncbi:M48 family metallopeptidase [Octadecabacter sp.]|nr:M48 family metallopeptidase [Octadecabacter sp.]
MSEKTIINVDGPTDITAPMRVVEGQGLFLDGDRATPQPVRLTYDDAAQRLVLHTETGRLNWRYTDLRALRDQAGDDTLILRLQNDPTARLVVQNPQDRHLVRSRAKRLNKRAKTVRRGRLLSWAAAAIGSVALIIFVLVPIMADQLAKYLPPAGERALGDATFEQIRTALDETGFAGLATCDAPDGLAALGKMENRITAGMDLETPLTVHVLDHPMVNAFALPGGYVVFFRGLLEEAETAEEVAAVFAHETGHVVARDPTRIALRSAGSIGVLGLLLGDFAGGAVVLFMAERIIQADYTQDAEAAADVFAHNALLGADLPPSAIATFFERLSHGDHESGFMEHFQSHPALGDRIAAAREAEPENAEFRPVLTNDEWAALQSICD